MPTDYKENGYLSPLLSIDDLINKCEKSFSDIKAEINKRAQELRTLLEYAEKTFRLTEEENREMLQLISLL